MEFDSISRLVSYLKLEKLCFEKIAHVNWRFFSRQKKWRNLPQLLAFSAFSCPIWEQMWTFRRLCFVFEQNRTVRLRLRVLLINWQMLRLESTLSFEPLFGRRAPAPSWAAYSLVVLIRIHIHVITQSFKTLLRLLQVRTWRTNWGAMRINREFEVWWYCLQF